MLAKTGQIFYCLGALVLQEMFRGMEIGMNLIEIPLVAPGFAF